MPAWCNLARSTSLRGLYLAGTDITDAGLESLRSLTKLRELGLCGTGLTDAGLVHIHELTNLRVLDLRETHVTDSGLAQLKLLTSLQKLCLSGTAVSRAGVQETPASVAECADTPLIRHPAPARPTPRSTRPPRRLPPDRAHLRRLLPRPLNTLPLLLLQTLILHGNTAVNHLPRLSGSEFTASAYCQARARLPLALFQTLLRRVADAVHAMADDTGTWRGHGVFVVDGCGCSMPGILELREHFGQPTGQRPCCGFPLAHLRALFRVGTWMRREVLNGTLFTDDIFPPVTRGPSTGSGSSGGAPSSG